MKNIDFDIINQKLESGLKLRIDVGLSITMPYSMEWLETYDDILVLGFEPHPVCYQSSMKCLSNSEFFDRSYIFEAAIDNVLSPVQKVFYGLDGEGIDFNIGTSSLKKPIGRFENFIDKVYNVNTISLKYVLDNLNYEFVEYIKTDTQGNDLNVLKSLGEHIKNVIWIQSEYDSSGDYQFANTGKELDDFLSENNFEKSDPVFCYYTDDFGNMMYDVADYKYKNLTL